MSTPTAKQLWDDDRITLTVDVMERRKAHKWGELDTDDVIELIQRVRDEYEAELAQLRERLQETRDATHTG